MSSFTTKLILEYFIEDRKPYYKLVEPFEYYTEIIVQNSKGDGYLNTEDIHYSVVKYLYKTIQAEPAILSIPEGFVTNFASIPKFFHNILRPDGVHGKAAVVHDYLYSTVKENFEQDLINAKSSTDIDIAVQLMNDSRKTADDIFKEAMNVLKVVAWKRDVMYTMVRFFGFSSILTVEDYG